jgi:hypothetical protein
MHELCITSDVLPVEYNTCLFPRLDKSANIMRSMELLTALYLVVKLPVVPFHPTPSSKSSSRTLCSHCECILPSFVVDIDAIGNHGELDSIQSFQYLRAFEDIVVTTCALKSTQELCSINVILLSEPQWHPSPKWVADMVCRQPCMTLSSLHIGKEYAGLIPQADFPKLNELEIMFKNELELILVKYYERLTTS